MIRLSLVAGAAALCFTPIAQAQYNYQDYNRSQHSNCADQKDDNRVLGSVLGAVAGGLIGVAIADDGDDYYHRRGYRGHRGYHGYRGYRGHRYHRHNDGDEVAGALIGGVLGAVVGGEIASSNTDCRTSYASNYAYNGVAPPTRQPFGNQQATTTTPVYQPGPQTQSQNLYGGPRATEVTEPIRITRPNESELTTPSVAQCTTVQRQTRLPDGNLVLEPVEVCQDASGEWNMATDYQY